MAIIDFYWFLIRLVIDWLVLFVFCMRKTMILRGRPQLLQYRELNSRDHVNIENPTSG